MTRKVPNPLFRIGEEYGRKSADRMRQAIAMIGEEYGRKSAIFDVIAQMPTIPNRPQTPSPRLKRSALVAKYQRRWPTINDDLSNAARNGLRTAAKADGGFWFEQAALQWATERGKLEDIPHLPAFLR